MGMAKMMIVLLAAVVVVLGTAISTTEAQTQTCASKLVPCFDFLNSTATPPSSCCDPIKEAVEDDLNCLCNLYNTPGLLASFNVSVSDALRLTRSCGVNTDLTACNSSNAPSPASTPPPGVPGNDGGLATIAGAGITSLLLILATVALY